MACGAHGISASKHINSPRTSTSVCGARAIGTIEAAVAQILRTRFLPHIFMTGDVYRLGVDPGAIVLQKPYALNQLKRAIVRAMGTDASS
jgi:hypothetical protein